MATKIQHKRTSTFSAAFPVLAPGELAFNGPQLKIAMGDPNTGAPVELLAVRFFSTTSSYATNDFITTAGTILRAIHPVAPGPFNAADWQGAAAGVPEAPIDGNPYFRQNAAWTIAALAALGGVPEAPNDGKAYSRKTISWIQLTATDVTYGAGSVSDALDNAVHPSDLTSDAVTNTSGIPGVTVSNALVNLQSVDATKAPIASPAFTGTPTSTTPPAADNSFKIPTTAWVQALAAGKASIVTSDVVPVTPVDNTLWWESDTAKLYLRYNDGNSSQWVQVNAAAGMGGYVTKIGDTMTGPLILSGDPIVPLGAATKQYADTKLPLMGVTNGSDAPAGQIGEFVTANAPSTVTLVSGVWTNLVSISLTAGDWDVWGSVQHTSTIGSGSMSAGVTLVSATSPVPVGPAGGLAIIAGPNFTASILTIPTVRYSRTATTTVYLIAQQGFASGVAQATPNSFIMARRVR